MEIKKLEGIVVSETNYSESSKILNVLTKEYGIIGIMSKGCRKLKSPLRSVSTKLVYGNFHIYYKKDGVSTLINVDVLDSFMNIRSDITKISYASFLLELTEQVYKQNNNSDIFNLFTSALIKINEGFDSIIITNILELKYLDYLGIGLQLDGCSICGNSEDIVTISGKQGGYLCRECCKDEIILSTRTIKLIRMFYYVDISKISKLELHYDTIKEIDNFLDEYYDDYSGLYLKSKQLLKNISKIG